MIAEVVKLTEKYSAPTLTCMAIDDFHDKNFKNLARDALLILPGGGYHNISKREGELVALPFMAADFNAFVLDYGIWENAAFPAPVIEVSLAIKYIRDNSKKYHVNPDRIFVLGFSAGGHLAASIGSLWCDEEIYAAAGVKYGENRPYGVILSYPVISGDPEVWHRNSFRFLTGDANNKEGELSRELCEKYSIDKRVSENTVPTFIWSTVEDQLVPVENTLRMACALQKHKIPYELHVYPTGSHGLSLANATTAGGVESKVNKAVAGWVNEAIRWAKELKI